MVGIIDDVEDKLEEGKEAIEELIDEVKEEAEEKPKKKAVKKVTKKASTKKSEDKDLEKKAEAESTTKEKELAEKKKALLEKAKKLKEKVEKAPESEELKEQVKIKKKEMLLPLEEYVQSGIYIGTRVVTPGMRQFVYRRRADGLAIFNTDLIDEKLREGIEYLSKFNPEDIIVVCKREAGWKAVKKFGEITGIRVFTKKYPAGILTNIKLPNFFENELTLVTDAWVDKNALNDTLRVNKKVLMICDTNNFPKGASQIILGNNKSPRSIGLIYYLLTKGYCKNKGIDAEIPDLEWWTGEFEEDKKSKKKSKEIVADPEIMSSKEGYGI